MFWRNFAGAVGETKGTWQGAAESPAGSRGRVAEGGQGEPHESVAILAHGVTKGESKCAVWMLFRKLLKGC